jgi:hypothetical protein
MEINLHNYEAFFLDYKEGNLSAEQEKELFLFLEENPHLYEELHAFENVVLDDFATDEIFAAKSSIKKNDFTEETLIAYTEGILDVQSKNEVEILASQNAAFKKELSLYKSTIIIADVGEKFKNKSKLKRGGVVILLQNNYTFLRVAAAILLVAGLFFLVSNLTSKEEIKNKTEVADLTNKSAAGIQQSAVVAKEESPYKKELAVNTTRSTSNGTADKSNSLNVKKENSVKEIIPQPENKNLAVNPVQTTTVSVIKNSPKDTIEEKEVLVKNNSVESPATIKSFYNYHPDKEEDEAPVIASAPAKKTFFQKLVKAAKNVNGFGLKNVNASEENNSNKLSIGSFVVTETISN